MIVRAKLSIGYPGAIQEDDVEIDDDILEGLTPDERADVIDQHVEQWANDYIEWWYEENPDGE